MLQRGRVPHTKYTQSYILNYILSLFLKVIHVHNLRIKNSIKLLKRNSSHLLNLSLPSNSFPQIQPLLLLLDHFLKFLNNTLILLLIDFAMCGNIEKHYSVVAKISDLG